MNYLEKMLIPENWDQFYDYKKEKNLIHPQELQKLREFIDGKEYVPIVENMINGCPLSAPRKKLISKTDSSKKRAVYIYREDENYVLKMLSWLLRDLERLLCNNLYSFRTDLSIKSALDLFLRESRKNSFYTYKIDVSNYFNSIPVQPMVKMIYDRIDDKVLCRFLEAHLNKKEVEYNGEIIEEEKGVMAGTPISPFLANLYLTDLDETFKGDLYARYADDIIFFARTSEERDEKEKKLLEFVYEKGLAVNPAKVKKTDPGEPWTFLGIKYCNGNLDICDISMKKIKDKLRRKSRALVRWKRRKNATNEQALKAFIRAVNRRFYDNPKNTELTWSRWYFPLITTDESLKEIDRYVQNCIRYIMFENHSKKSYSFRYEDMKKFGYRSLVHEFYKE